MEASQPASQKPAGALPLGPGGVWWLNLQAVLSQAPLRPGWGLGWGVRLHSLHLVLQFTNDFLRNSLARNSLREFLVIGVCAYSLLYEVLFFLIGSLIT